MIRAIGIDFGTTNSVVALLHADGRVTTLDQAAAGARLRAAQERMEALAPSRDYRASISESNVPN